MITKCTHTPVACKTLPGWMYKKGGKLMDNYFIQIATLFRDAAGSRETYDPMGNVIDDPLPPLIKGVFLRWPEGHAHAGEHVFCGNYQSALEVIASGKSAEIEAQYEAGIATREERDRKRGLELSARFTGADLAAAVAAGIAAQPDAEARRGPGRPRNEAAVGA